MGTLAAIIFPMDDITGFLYIIGSIFAPMIAVQIADFFILKRKASSSFDIRNIIIWAIGFLLYRILMQFDFILGNTVPDMIITVIICIITDLFIKKCIKCKNDE